MKKNNDRYEAPLRAADISPEQAAKTLGSFDPTSLLINLNIAARDDASQAIYRLSPDLPIVTAARDEVLARCPAWIVAHELTHFFQTTTTAFGVRSFAVSLELLRAKLLLIEAAAKTNRGELRAPVLKHVKAHRPGEEIRKALEFYYAALAAHLFQYGGWEIAQDQWTGEPNWLTRPVDGLSLSHRPYPSQLVAVNLSKVNGRPAATILGSRHLREGAAKAIDMVQGRLAGELSSHPHPAVYGSGMLPMSDEQRRLADPYFLCNILYNTALHGTAAGDGATLEEFAAVVDLALMSDPIVLSWEELKDAPDERQHRDRSCGEAYVYLLSVLSDCYDALPRFDRHWRQAEVVAFQSELWRRAGWPVDLVTMVAKCERFIADCFAWAREALPLYPPLLDVYEQAFVGGLRWRREVLSGGAVLEDLLTSEAKLKELFIMCVPAFVVGSNVFSAVQSDPGFGVGVEMATIRQLHDLTDALILDDRACPAHVEQPRACVVEIQELCAGLRNGGAHRRECARSSTLKALERLGITAVRWS